MAKCGSWQQGAAYGGENQWRNNGWRNISMSMCNEASIGMAIMSIQWRNK
jgi:hypothetical protein